MSVIHFVLVSFPLLFIALFFIIALFRKHVVTGRFQYSTPRREFFLILYLAYLLTLAFYLFAPNSLLSEVGISLGVDVTHKMPGDWGMNLRPLSTIRLYKNLAGMNAIINIWGNILLMIPVGFFPPLLFRRMGRFLPLLLTSLPFFILVELIQYQVGRSADIDDILLYIVGLLIGFLLAKLFPPLYRKGGR